jgi:hypothetical protein
MSGNNSTPQMENSQPDPQPAWTLTQLIEALNQVRDTSTSAALKLRDMQVDLDTAQHQEAIERVNDLMTKVK